jgi:hypothetical protein
MKEFLCNVRRVLYWLPIIWSDRWWDSAFLLRVMEAKLRWDAKHYGEHGITCSADRHAKQMLIAAILCKRLRENNYTTPWDEEAGENTSRLLSYISSNRKEHDGVVWHSSKGYEADKALARAADWARKHSDEMQKQDIALLCDILRRNVRSWWD